MTQTNKGISAARNTGIKQAAGACLCFVDSDDYIHPQMLEALHESLEREQADIAACGFEHVAGERAFTLLDLSQVKWVMRESPFVAPFSRKISVPWGCEAWRKLYRRKLFDNLSFVEEIIGVEDVVFTTCVLCDTQTIVWTREKLYFYRDVPSSITKTAITVRKVRSYLDAIRAMHHFYAQQKYSRALNRILQTMSCSCMDVLFRLMVRQCPDQAESLRLFEFIQPGIQEIKAAGMVSYHGLKWRQKLVLFLLVHFPHARYAFKAGQLLLNGRSKRLSCGV